VANDRNQTRNIHQGWDRLVSAGGCRRLLDLVLEGLDDTHLRDVARGARLDDAGLFGEGVDALACLASLAFLGQELAHAVEHERLALVHLVVDELEETLVHLLAHLALDTRHVLKTLEDLGLAHLLALGGLGLLATVMDTSGLFDDDLGGLGGLLLLGSLLRSLLGLTGRALLGLAGRALLALLGLAGGTLLHDHVGIEFTTLIFYSTVKNITVEGYPDWKRLTT